MFSQVTPEREPSCPRKGPIGKSGVRVAGLDLDGVPQRQHIVGQVEADLVESSNGPKASVAEDKGAVRGGYRVLLGQ